MGTTGKVVRIRLVVSIAGLWCTNLISGTVVTELLVPIGVFYPHNPIEFLPFVFAIRYLSPKES